LVLQYFPSSPQQTMVPSAFTAQVELLPALTDVTMPRAGASGTLVAASAAAASGTLVGGEEAGALPPELPATPPSSSDGPAVACVPPLPDVPAAAAVLPAPASGPDVFPHATAHRSKPTTMLANRFVIATSSIGIAFLFMTLLRLRHATVKKGSAASTRASIRITLTRKDGSALDHTIWPATPLAAGLKTGQN
jgi:hypothetical protein